MSNDHPAPDANETERLLATVDMTHCRFMTSGLRPEVSVIFDLLAKTAAKVRELTSAVSFANTCARADAARADIAEANVRELQGEAVRYEKSAMKEVTDARSAAAAALAERDAAQAQVARMRSALNRAKDYVANHDHEGRSEREMDDAYPECAMEVADVRALIAAALTAHQPAKGDE